MLIGVVTKLYIPGFVTNQNEDMFDTLAKWEVLSFS